MHFAERVGNRANLKHLKPVRYWHRPVGGLYEVFDTMMEKGVDTPTSLEGRYMELYIASLFGIALEQFENREFWIAKPKEDPPDMAFMTMAVEGENRFYFHSREIEITRHTPTSKKSLVETILSKDRAYPGDYVIVCFIEMDGQLDFQKLSLQLVTQLKHIQHVFLVFHGAPVDVIRKLPDKNEYKNLVSVVQISPVYNFQVINLLEHLKRGFEDQKRLVYVQDTGVYYGKRPEDSNLPGMPKIIV
jgi:hypothetical protein